MPYTKNNQPVPQEQVLQEAIVRECTLSAFYRNAAGEVGEEAGKLLLAIAKDHEETARQLEHCSTELEEERELTAAIAD